MMDEKKDEHEDFEKGIAAPDAAAPVAGRAPVALVPPLPPRYSAPGPRKSSHSEASVAEATTVVGPSQISGVSGVSGASRRTTDRDINASTLQELVDESVYKWLVPSIQGQTSGYMSTENRAIAWLVVLSQLVFYFAAGGFAINAQNQFSASNGVPSCSYSDSLGVSTISSGFTIAPTCSKSQQSPNFFVTAFAAAVVLTFTANDLLTGIYMFKLGYWKTAVVVFLMLIGAYFATMAFMVYSVKTVGGNIAIITSAVAVIFVAELDEKSYLWMKYVDSPSRRFGALGAVALVSLVVAIIFQVTLS